MRQEAISIPLYVNYKDQLTLDRKITWKDFLEVGGVLWTQTALRPVASIIQINRNSVV